MTRYKLPLIILLTFTVISAWVITSWGRAERSQVYSCISSLRNALNASAVSNIKLSTPVDEAYKTLDESDYNMIVRSLANQTKSFDCGVKANTLGVFIDMWGHRIEIAVRKSNDGGHQFMVWSKGPDGISGTSDDIVLPRQKPPSI